MKNNDFPQVYFDSLGKLKEKNDSFPSYVSVWDSSEVSTCIYIQCTEYRNENLSSWSRKPGYMDFVYLHILCLFLLIIKEHLDIWIK